MIVGTEDSTWDQVAGSRLGLAYGDGGDCDVQGLIVVPMHAFVFDGRGE